MPETRTMRPAMLRSTMRLVSRAGARRWIHHRGPRLIVWAVSAEPMSSTSTRSGVSTPVTMLQSRRRKRRRLAFLESVADAVKRLNGLEALVGQLELLAQTLDVAVDRAVIDVDLIVIGGIHERVAALDDAGALGERLENQEFS